MSVKRRWAVARPSTDLDAKRLAAAVPRKRAASEEGTLGLAFTSLLGFHKLYSRALLLAARRRLAK